MYLSEALLDLSAGHPFEFGECVSEIEGNRPPIGKSVSASLRVRDVRASGRGEAVWACEMGVFVNAGGLHSNISFSCSLAWGGVGCGGGG